MGDYIFLQNKINGKWVISAPSRSHRTNVEKGAAVCPFCPSFAKASAGKAGREGEEEELYRVGGDAGDANWKIRVITNKYPFAPHHEVIIHSTDHHKNFDELPVSQVELILQTYRQRFIAHKKDGLVYIFSNSGLASGASLSHPHSQLVVIPQNVKLDITPLDSSIYQTGNRSSTFHLPFSNDKSDNDQVNGRWNMDDGKLATDHFYIFCPATSEWPDEVWIAPKQNGGGFGLIKDPEITDLGFVLSRLIQIFDLRHGHEFPFNFYIPPLKNWYLRLIPRTKIIGGFELGTNIIVNTQDPAETFKFIKEHFWKPDNERIRNLHQADYLKVL